MKSTQVFACMNDLPADMITAAELPEATLTAVDYGVTGKQKRRERFKLVTSSGWFAAAVSIVVALTVLTGIVIAGRNGGAVTPTPAGSLGGTGSPTDTLFADISNETQPLPDIEGLVFESDWLTDTNFAFKYTFRNETPILHPGDTVYLDAQVKNVGSAFTYEGSSTEFCPEVYLLDPTGERCYRMDHTVSDDYDRFTVATGDVGGTGYFFTLPADTLPADCPYGTYRIKMQYGGDSVVMDVPCFAVLVDGFTPVSAWLTDGNFSFRYVLFHDTLTLHPGECVTVGVFLQNVGPAFVCEGRLGAFRPEVYLVACDPADGVSYKMNCNALTGDGACTIETGFIHQHDYHFTLPADCPEGKYWIKMQYGDCGVVSSEACFYVDHSVYITTPDAVTETVPDVLTRSDTWDTDVQARPEA